jgi:hypothetical protein
MKTILVMTIAALLSESAFSQHPPLAEPAPGAVVSDKDPVKQKTRRFWVKAKGFQAEDEAAFTAGAQQALMDLGKEIDRVAGKVPVTTPLYFLTRLQALRQQHQYLQVKLQALTAGAIKTRQSGPRHAFEECVNSLASALDQADDEADMLITAGSPEKLEARK